MQSLGFRVQGVGRVQGLAFWAGVQGLGLGFERGGTSFVILISILCVDCDQFLPVLQIYFFYIEFDPSKSGVFLLIRIFSVFFILFF